MEKAVSGTARRPGIPQRRNDPERWQGKLVDQFQSHLEASVPYGANNATCTLDLPASILPAPCHGTWTFPRDPAGAALSAV